MSDEKNQAVKTESKPPITSVGRGDVEVRVLTIFPEYAVIEHPSSRTVRMLPTSEQEQYIPPRQTRLPRRFKMSKSSLDKLVGIVSPPDLGMGKDVQYELEKAFASHGIVDYKQGFHQSSIGGIADSVHRLVVKKLREFSNIGS